MNATSLFGQLLAHLPRTEFEGLARRHSAERYAKGFDCWTQIVSMLFCQLARADSLRQICAGLACCLGKLKHLGIAAAPKRSTLSYANGHRPAAFFRDFFFAMSARFRSCGQLGRRKSHFRFKNKLLSLDSTTISLCLQLFPWADFRRAKGGVKAHVLLDHDDYMPAWALITTAACHDVRIAQLLHFPAGSIVVMDRGYNDYGLFGSWTKHGVFFVTRMKDNATYRVLESRKAPMNSTILADETIALTGVHASRDCPVPLRRIVVQDEANDCQIVLLTNHLTFGSTTIAAIYKDRWEIELFFKAIKQNLKIKTFVGTSPNAIQIQIWTALIAMLLLKWLHYLSKAGWSLASMVALLRMNLFTYRHLPDWLNDPYGTPPSIPPPTQLPIPFPDLGQAAL